VYYRAGISIILVFELCSILLALVTSFGEQRHASV